MSFKTAELISLATKSQESYDDFLSEISEYVSAGGKNECKIVIDQIKRIIKDKKTLLTQKLLGLELLHHCIQLNKAEFLSYTQVKILKRLSLLAKKDVNSIFKDYPKTEENKQIASIFLTKLLNYIYIWANDYGQTEEKCPNEFAKEFYRLRETLTFPSPKKKQISRALSTTEPQIPKRPEKLSLEYILKILDRLERMPDPLSSESGPSMLESLREACPSIESSLSKALQNSNQKIIDRILKLNDRIQKVLQKCGMSDMKEDRGVEKQHQMEYRHSLPVGFSRDSVNEWGKEMEEGKGSDTEPEVPKLMFTIGPKGKAGNHERNESKESKTEILVKEIERLKSQIDEKDTAYAQLSEACLNLQNKIKGLESALAKTKELLLSKEKECEECHCLKPSLISSEPQEPEILFEPKPTQSLPPPQLYSAFDYSALLFEDKFSQISYEFSQQQDLLILLLRLANISGHRFSCVCFEIDSAFGFDIQLAPQPASTLAAKQFLDQHIYAKNLCITHSLPVLLFKYQYKQQNVQVSFQLPIHILRFSKPAFPASMQSLWQEWEMLTFDTETSRLAVQYSLPHCAVLLQTSQNALILTRSHISKLADNQLLALYTLNNKVFVLLELKPFDMAVDLEVRCESATLRKTVLTLLGKLLLPS